MVLPRIQGYTSKTKRLHDKKTRFCTKMDWNILVDKAKNNTELTYVFQMLSSTGEKMIPTNNIQDFTGTEEQFNNKQNMISPSKKDDSMNTCRIAQVVLFGCYNNII